MSGGTYTLLVELAEPSSLSVGALGSRAFAAGTYAYTGSARGPGGFARLARHREVAAGERDVRHWHVDSLLGASAAAVVGEVRSPDVDGECDVARTHGGRIPTVADVGASDCDCDAHLAGPAEADAVLAAAREAHAAVTGP